MWEESHLKPITLNSRDCTWGNQKEGNIGILVRGYQRQTHVPFIEYPIFTISTKLPNVILVAKAHIFPSCVRKDVIGSCILIRVSQILFDYKNHLGSWGKCQSPGSSYGIVCLRWDSEVCMFFTAAYDEASLETLYPLKFLALPSPGLGCQQVLSPQPLLVNTLN